MIIGKKLKRNKRGIILKKTLLTVFIFNIIQLVMLILLIPTGVIKSNSDFSFIIYIIAALVTLNGAITALGYYLIIYQKKDNGIVETINNLEELNRKLREQRHDYLNHIQIIYGLMEIDEYEEAKKYMEPVYNDILKVSKALRTSKPAINALLQAKLQMAEKSNIDMYLEIKTDLKLLNIEAWEFCKVISNIIDNGIHAVSTIKDKKIIGIDFGESLDSYYFYIYNNGPQIPEEYIDSIFMEGITTKGDEDHGMGLFIAKNIVQSAGGTISVSSDEKMTSFKIELPKVKL